MEENPQLKQMSQQLDKKGYYRKDLIQNKINLFPNESLLDISFKEDNLELNKKQKKKLKQPKINFFGKIFSWAYKLKLTRAIIKKFIFNPLNVPQYYFIQKKGFGKTSFEYKFRLVSQRDDDYLRTIKSPNIKFHCYKLYSKRLKRLYMNPVIVIENTNLKLVDQFTIIYSHGNSGDIGGDIFTLAQIALLFNCHVISFDYIGYGLSSGTPSEQKWYEDLETVMAFATMYLKTPLHKIFLWGYSLGSGPTIHMAAQYKNIAGIVLLAPLASVLLWCDKKLQ